MAKGWLGEEADEAASAENVEFSESAFSVEGPTHLCRVDSKRGEFGRQSLDLCYDTWPKS